MCLVAGAFEHRKGDQLALDLRFDLLREKAAEVGGRVLVPVAFGQLRDVGAQDGLSDRAGFRGQFPGVCETEGAPAVLTIKSGTVSAEESTLRVGGIVE